MNNSTGKADEWPISCYCVGPQSGHKLCPCMERGRERELQAIKLQLLQEGWTPPRSAKPQRAEVGDRVVATYDAQKGVGEIVFIHQGNAWVAWPDGSEIHSLGALHPAPKTLTTKFTEGFK